VTGEHIVEFEGVTKIYKSKASLFSRSSEEVVALRDLTLNIRKGEIFGLVGESGSGKTTAGRLLVKLEEPTEGVIKLDGTDITKLKGGRLKEFRRNVQMIFQDPYQSLNPQVSIFEAVCEPLVIHGIGNSGNRKEMVEEMLALVGLSPPEDFLARYPHQLSGGQRQRVAIARAMILKPTMVVADEPTSMLDASISAQIFNILLDMRERFQVSILFITHSLAAARYLCDRLGVIYKGSLMELGPSGVIIAEPRHPYTQALIDALPKFGQCGSVFHYGTLLAEERRGIEDGEGKGTKEFCPFFPRCRPARAEKCANAMPRLENLSPGHAIRCFFPARPSLQVETAGSSKCYYGI